MVGWVSYTWFDMCFCAVFVYNSVGCFYLIFICLCFKIIIVIFSTCVLILFEWRCWGLWFCIVAALIWVAVGLDEFVVLLVCLSSYLLVDFYLCWFEFGLLIVSLLVC